MADVNGPSQRYSLTNNSYLGYRSSGVLARRLSVYMQNIFPNVNNVQKLITELNSQVSLYRELLIQIGQARDNPEMRKEIRKIRQMTMATCQQTVELITTEDRGCTNLHGNYVVPLLCMLQLFSKELIKSYRLIEMIPLDMSKHNNENRNRPTNLGNVIGQILLCKDITPDFNQEELYNIENDIGTLNKFMAELKSKKSQKDSTTANEENYTSLRFQNGTRLMLQRDDSENAHFLCCILRHK